MRKMSGNIKKLTWSIQNSIFSTNLTRAKLSCTLGLYAKFFSLWGKLRHCFFNFFADAFILQRISRRHEGESWEEIYFSGADIPRFPGHIGDDAADRDGGGGAGGQLRHGEPTSQQTVIFRHPVQRSLCKWW